MKLILASGSPRRRELLTKRGLTYDIEISHEEEFYTETSPEKIVMQLASQKAAAISKNHTEDCVVIGADTVVSYDGKILGKPASYEDAFNMIKDYQAHTHQVYTGVCLILLKDGIRKDVHFFSCTDVDVMPLSDEEIHGYLALGESMDAAGAYKIQGGFGKYITAFHGDYENVIGLPTDQVLLELKKLAPEVLEK